VNSSSSVGGNGITGFGGTGRETDGSGGVFTGGSSSAGNGDGDIGIGKCFECNSEAGNFGGDVFATGHINSLNESVKIDHPLDPANKYLIHSSVGSSEMKNMYDGTVTTDANGRAVVNLPEWFEALNSDFRYQLTVIGQFAQAIIAGKIADHHFTIRTDRPNVEVSWQVTGVRHDAWANAYRSPAEVDKPLLERGHYLHPQLFGAPEEAGVEWARHPQIMKKMKEARQKQLHAAQSLNVAR
jgi:hypothetical protein